MKKPSLKTIAALLLLLLLGSLVAGCASIGYLAQSMHGHLSLVQQARPVRQWLADPAVSEDLRERLRLSQRMRDFAVRELRLPDNASYRRYADLGRPAAVWNVVAAPELGLELRRWCFPVVGCVGYRGYYDRAQAEAQAAALRAEGLEVLVYAVPAYSTLGRLDWLGGDPLLNTFIRYPEGELARMIFHELAHQVAYASGDTVFNESFATTVERLGGERWLSRSTPEAREEYARHERRRSEFRALVLGYRERLDALYRSALPPEAKRLRKAELFARMRQDHARLKRERWDGFAGYDGWFERANNASLGVLAAYHSLVPGFERLFEAQQRDFGRFYAEVRRLAAAPPEERRRVLEGAPH